MRAGAAGAVLSMLVAVAAGSCGSKPSSSGAASGSDVEPAPIAVSRWDMLAYVPADTPYVVNVSANLLDMADSWLVAALMPALEGAIIGREQLPGATAKDRLRSEIAREFAPLDASALQRIGWDVDRSGFVIYGQGLVPVLRASMNGPAAREALDRVAKRADITLEAHEANGIPYVVIPATGEHDVPITVFFHPQQVVATMTTDLNAILPHVTSLGPAAVPLALDHGSKPGNPSAPAGSEVYMSAEPEKIARWLRAGELQLVSRDPRFTMPCATRIADLVDDLPAFTDQFWMEDGLAIRSYALTMNPLLSRLVPRDASIEWVDEADIDIQLAVGIPLGPVVTWMSEVSKAIIALREACKSDPSPPLPIGPHVDALSQVKGFTIVAEARGKDVHIGAQVNVDDANAFLAWVGPTFFQQALPELPLNELVNLGQVNGLTLGLARSDKRVFGSLGSPERAQRMSKDGGTVSAKGTVARFYMARDFVRDVRTGKVEFFGFNLMPDSQPAYDSGSLIDVTFFGDVLVIHHAGSTQVAPAAK